MCCLLNVFHDRTGLIASIHTHLNVAVVRSFFLIFSDSVEQRTLVCAGCASCTFSFLSFFFDELFNSTKF